MDNRSPKWILGRILRCAIFSVVLATLVSCSTTRNPDDPLEPFNRAMFSINHRLDTILFHPLALGYDKVVPNFAKRGVNNFFYNFYEPTRIINHILRAEFTYALEATSRFMVNTTVGIGGLFDVAGTSRMQLPRRRSDLGMTLAKWGYRNSTFLMVPIFGPTTFRDGGGYLIDLYAFTFWPHIEPRSLAWQLYGVELLHHRHALLPTDELIRDAMDPYTFMRDAWLQKRRAELAQVVPGYYDVNEDTFVEGDEETSAIP